MQSLLKSRFFHSLFGIGISLILLLVMVLAVDDWQLVFKYLGEIHLWVIWPSLLVLFLHFTLRALRWRYLLPQSQRLGFMQLFDPILMGAFATYILPLRAGEFVRPYLLARSSSLSFSSCFVSVVVERFFDLAMVLLGFGVMVFYVPGIPEWAHYGASILACLALAILAFMSIGALFPQPLEKLIEAVVRPLPRKVSQLLSKFLKDFLQGALVLKSPVNLFKVVLLSALVWISCFVQFAIFCHFFDMNASFWVGVSVALIIALAVAAPSAPGFLGVYQSACIAGFALFGISHEFAAAYSIVTHLFQYVCFTLYGVVFLLRKNLSFSDIKQAASARTTT